MKKRLGIAAIVIGFAAVVLALIIQIKGHMSFVIGGADGPTSVFVTGKTGDSFAVVGMLAGIAMFAAGMFMAAGKK